MDRNSLTENRERSVSYNTELNGQPCWPWGSRVSVVSFTDHLLCLRHVCHTIGSWGKSESKFLEMIVVSWTEARKKREREREQILNSNLSQVHRTCLLFSFLCVALELVYYLLFTKKETETQILVKFPKNIYKIYAYFFNPP